jgi:membrane-bound lytic murein transglycosylase D
MTRIAYIFLTACLFAVQSSQAADISITLPGTQAAATVVQPSTTPSQPTAPPSQPSIVEVHPGAAVNSDPSTGSPFADTSSVDLSTLPVVNEVPVTDLWQRLRAGMSLPEMDNSLVHSNEQWFSNHPAYMLTTLSRARLYLFHIVDEVDKRHMPMEIALLPMIESAYNPQALSHSDASGIWQFLPSTGKVFGLKQNGWYDGRRDVVNATQAALDYLQRLHGMFNDWELALAAYNCGEGCVSRAIAKNRARGLATDFSSLDLPAETRNYVPRLLAIRNVIREPDHFGVALDGIPNAPSFQKVTLTYPIEAKTAARLAQMDMDDFLALNPGFRRRVIYSESQNTLLLPPDKAELFNRNLAETESSNIRMHAFQAPKGAMLSRIADRFDVTIQWLKDHNPLEVKRGKLAKAQTLMLPPPVVAPSKTVVAAKPASTQPVIVADARVVETRHHESHAQSRHAKARVHTVRKGDTLYSLAKHYNVKVADIVGLNHSLKTLHPGEKIHIPVDG